VTRGNVQGDAPAFPDGLPLVRPRFDDIPGIMADLQGVLESGQLTNGRYVAELEERLAERLGVAHVVAVNSCTAGLMLVYQGLGVRGDVVMPSHTFSASAHAVMWAGGRPRFADIEPSRATLDPADVRQRVDGAAAISATHLYGHPAEIDELEAIASDEGVPLVFDSAHALGSRHGDRAVGSFGTAEVFSMSPTKVTVAGEGGLVATSDPDLARHVRIGRADVNPRAYNCAFPGLNARMSELHAVLALASLAGLDDRLSRRRELVSTFATALGSDDRSRVIQPAVGDTSTYKDLTLHLPMSDVTLVQKAFGSEGVDTRRYFWPPAHLQDAYRHLPTDGSLSCTEKVAGQLLTLPLHSDMEQGDVQRLADVLGDVLDRCDR
jgi:dTDP-4-amino-4,6-dideoxygalactose transaminase